MTETTWIVGAVAALASLAAAAAHVRLAALRAEIERLRRDAHARMGASESDARALCASVRATGDRVVDVERSLKRAVERVDRIEMSGAEPESYRHAFALAARGASSEDLVADCGLGREEADLVTLMYQHGRLPRSPTGEQERISY